MFRGSRWPFRFILHRPQREPPRKPLHRHALVPRPLQPLVLPRPQPVNVLLGPLAHPDFRILDGSDHARGEVHRAVEHIPFLHAHRPDVDAGADAHLRMAGAPLQRPRVVQCPLPWR